MTSESFLASDFPAPPPRWAVGASLGLIALFAAIFVMTLPSAERGENTADASVNSSLRQ